LDKINEDNPSVKKFLNNSLDETYILLNKSPRILLGQSKHLTEKFPYFLVDFIDTVNAFREIKIDQNFFSSQHYYIFDSKQKTIFCLDYEIVKRAISLYETQSIANNSSIILALVYRLILATFILNKNQTSTKNKHRHKALYAQLFIDTHLDLIRFMSFNNVYEDEDLISKFSEKMGVYYPALTCYYPSDDRFIFGGDLPDFTTCIDIINLWNDVKPKGDTIFSAIIHLLCKTQNQKCQQRNMISIVKNYFIKYPILIDLYRLIIQISLLGNYPNVINRPDILTRMDIYFTFDKRNMSDSKFYEWLEQNEFILNYASKEFFLYITEVNWLMNEVLKSEVTWDLIKNNIYSAMDTTRSILKRKDLYIDNLFNENMSKEEFDFISEINKINIETFKKIQSELIVYHEDALRFLNRSKKTSFLNIVEKQMFKIVESNALDKFSTAPVRNEDFIPPQILEIIDYTIQAINWVNGDPFPLKWLIFFGLQRDSFEIFSKLYYDFEKKITGESEIYKELVAIYINEKIDFHILYYYTKELLTKSETHIFLLPKAIRDEQYEALKRRYKILPWQTLDEKLYQFYYCRACKNWSSPHISFNRTDLNAVYSYGIYNAIYNFDTNTLTCKRESNSLIIKKLKSKRQMNDTRIEADEAAAKKLRVYNSSLICKKTVLEHVNMLGIIFQLKNKNWVLCVVCGVITPFDHHTLSQRGLTCPLHSYQTITTIQPQPLPFHIKYKKHISDLYKKFPVKNEDIIEYEGILNEQQDNFESNHNLQFKQITIKQEEQEHQTREIIENNEENENEAIITSTTENKITPLTSSDLKAKDYMDKFSTKFWDNIEHENEPINFEQKKLINDLKASEVKNMNTLNLRKNFTASFLEEEKKRKTIKKKDICHLCNKPYKSQDLIQVKVIKNRELGYISICQSDCKIISNFLENSNYVCDYKNLMASWSKNFTRNQIQKKANF
jgi:hypothetical protein